MPNSDLNFFNFASYGTAGYNPAVLSFLILFSAFCNLLIGILALRSSVKHDRYSFPAACFLLAGWNLSWYLGTQYNLREFFMINFILSSFIPPFFFSYVINLEPQIVSLRLLRIRLILFITAFLNMLFISAAIFFNPLKNLYYSAARPVYIFIYIGFSLLCSLLLLIYRYYQADAGQKKRILYLIAGFSAVYPFGMLDLFLSIKTGRFFCIGNTVNFLFALIIYQAIQRHRLFKTSIVSEELFPSIILSAFWTIIFFTISRFTADKTGLQLFLFAALIFFLYFFRSQIMNAAAGIIGFIGITSPFSRAAAEIESLQKSRPVDEELIEKMLEIITINFRCTCRIYTRQGAYWLLRWPAEGGQRVYSTGNPAEQINIFSGAVESAELCKIFNADLLLGFKNSPDFLLGFKSVQDGFSREEAGFLTGCRNFLETPLLHLRSIEDSSRKEQAENMALAARQMAHEIKNPLASLWGAAQLLPADLNEYVEIIHSETGRIMTILDEWRDFSSAGNIKPCILDPGLLLQNCIKLVMLRPGFPPVTAGSINTGLSINGDTDKLKQVILNIFINSAEALTAAKSPRIHAHLIKNEAFAEINITDNGPGIARELLEKITDAFFTTKTRGTGLGLSISDKIIQAHGGNLIVESDSKSYTSVKILLPCLEETA
ncbi:MAG: hypothetical protein A2096_03635 [Spirochaetes bacterium GWF1_41_5]|nr:MAG: hypothetical protein A2096_03635 [Spirochaetes bacterium GWF1_41_5]HBE02948.1 hypothetical protein [Spirochaetia bacterium]